MYEFRKDRRHSLDLDKIYNCTGKSKEEGLETESKLIITLQLHPTFHVFVAVKQLLN